MDSGSKKCGKGCRGKYRAHVRKPQGYLATHEEGKVHARSWKSLESQNRAWINWSEEMRQLQVVYENMQSGKIGPEGLSFAERERNAVMWRRLRCLKPF